MESIFLRIEWRATPSRELINIPLGPPPIADEIKQTEDYWLEEDRVVIYNTTSVRRILKDGRQKIKINYSEQNNRQLSSAYPGARVLWGTSIIVVSADRESATVEWKGNPPDSQYDGITGCRVLSQGLFQKEEREFFSRRKRKQAAFRKLLLEYQQCCAISGEKTESALEAAHILEASSSGAEVIENGILLRADIHRMYDAGIFEIRQDGSIDIRGKISDEYRKMLKLKNIDPKITSRISKALEQRAQKDPG